MYDKANRMKKVNKQCLLDTIPPCTVRVSEKLGKLWFKPADLSFKKISVESVQTKIINSFMHMFVSAKYQIAPSKAVVGVDRPIKALSMHIQKPYKGIIV